MSKLLKGYALFFGGGVAAWFLNVIVIADPPDCGGYREIFALGVAAGFITATFVWVSVTDRKLPGAE